MDRKKITKSSVGTLLGSTIEWYDFFIYGTASALVFNKIFFAQLSPALGTVLSLLTFAVGFLSRPIGAIVFGHVGDRYGRKTAFTWSLLIMGLASVAIGVLPTSGAVGGWIAVVLVCLRIVQGVGVGGEWGGATLYMTENASPRWRAFFGVVPQLGSPLGTILSNGIFLMVASLPEEQLYSWGWRIPFLLSLVLVIVGFVIRLTLDETEDFKSIDNKTEAAFPLKEIVVHAWGRILLVSGSRLLELTGFTIATVFVLSYVSGTLGGSKSEVTSSVVWGGVAELVTLPIFAIIMLRVKPKHLIYWAGGLIIVYSIPFFLLININTGASFIIAMIIWFPIISLPFAAYPTLFSDLFDTRIRYSGMSIGYNLVGIVSGFAPAIASALYAATQSWWGVACMMMFAGAVSVVSVMMMQLPSVRGSAEKDRVRLDAASREATRL